jgi:hypothetical protein
MTPPQVHGKEGVDGSSPSEGLKIPANRNFLGVCAELRVRRGSHPLAACDDCRCFRSAAGASEASEVAPRSHVVQTLVDRGERQPCAAREGAIVLRRGSPSAQPGKSAQGDQPKRLAGENAVVFSSARVPAVSVYPDSDKIGGLVRQQAGRADSSSAAPPSTGQRAKKVGTSPREAYASELAVPSVLVVDHGDVRDADDRAFRRMQPGYRLTPRFLARWVQQFVSGSSGQMPNDLQPPICSLW